MATRPLTLTRSIAQPNIFSICTQLVPLIAKGKPKGKAEAPGWIGWNALKCPHGGNGVGGQSWDWKN